MGVAINATQIIALLFFSCLAIAHRTTHAEGSNIWVLDSTGTPTQYVQDTMPDTGKTIPDPKDASKPTRIPSRGIPKVDPGMNRRDGRSRRQAEIDQGTDGNPMSLPRIKMERHRSTRPVRQAARGRTISYLNGMTKDPKTGIETFNYHDSAKSVIAPHKFGYVIIQACIAILILVGFESVTSMGEEAKNAKRDIPKAVILSLVIQGGFCYLFEYFAANYYLNSGYTATTAGGSSAPIGDIMQLVGAWAFGSAKAGWWFMIIEAITVFLALIGTTLSCINTGARVTYAMGRDEEMGAHFGMLHGKNAHAAPCDLDAGDDLRRSSAS